jgi:hypothetical protein
MIGNCRRDLPDQAIVLNERHLNRLMNVYVRYYRDDRTHLDSAACIIVTTSQLEVLR